MRYNYGSTPTRYNYTGQRLDYTGLLYYGARYYDPTLMRFTQPDTLVPDPANPQSLNRYAYVLNNPLRYTDPTGHIVCGFQGRPCPSPPTFTPISIQTGIPFIDYHVELVVNLTVCGLLPCKAENGAIRPLTQEEYLQAAALNTATAVQPMTAVAADEALALGKQLALPGFEDIIEEAGKDASRTIRHHIATNKNWVRDPQWSRDFQELFAKGGMSLENVANIVELPAEVHKGAHSQAYHKWVYQRLQEAIAGLDDPAQIRAALEARLRWIAEQLQAHPEWLKNPPVGGGR